ncbi:MAG: hypothetical protein J7604_25560 [Sporocytophaga sp.]|uniref:hypothetical protein n=1 Tax=Sporocytophaga sp. TaxID=2231183 RepID=UPI001B275CD0|nr:hypothetical protein [Sporocytophaga sp.]MBO9703597.1 hypothetical protein [Sporocytophaga sp.]
MVNFYRFLKKFLKTKSLSGQSNNDQINQAGFNLKDKLYNLETIKKHFDKLNLYSYFDIEIIQDDNELQLDEIEYGIVSGFAIWSGPAYALSNHILNLIKHSNKPKIRLIIIDTDYISIELQKKIFETVMHGYFESCLIINGEINKRYKRAPDIEPFINAVNKSR